MYDRILVGYLDTEQGRDALELGRVLAGMSHAEMLVVTASGEDGRDLAELARSEAADLVVLGSSHRGPLGRVVPGAMVGHLLGAAPCAVAVAPTGFGTSAEGYDSWRPLSDGVDDSGLRVVGVGFDGSHAAREALDRVDPRRRGGSRHARPRLPSRRPPSAHPARQRLQDGHCRDELPRPDLPGRHQSAPTGVVRR